jgi:hypothetical protein
MDTNSRRAFALDSRTVWVEQQIVGSTIIAKDNLVLGPGEYHAKLQERHVSTPSLGGSKKVSADFFPSFRTDLNIRTPLGKGSPSRVRSPSPQKSGSVVELRDFSTTFHETEGRNPYDPKNITCPTPLAYVSHTDALKLVKNDGVYETKSTIPFGANIYPVPFGERNVTKLALPDYDPKFDSNQLRPSAKLGSFQKAKRIHIPTKDELDCERQSPLNLSPGRQSSSLSSPSLALNQLSVYNEQPQEKPLTQFQIRCSLVAIPKVKTRLPPTLTFDASSYHSKALQKPLNLTPKLINNAAKVNVYGKVLTIPRKHKSCSVAEKFVVRPRTSNLGDNASEDSSEDYY